MRSLATIVLLGSLGLATAALPSRAGELAITANPFGVPYQPAAQVTFAQRDSLSIDVGDLSVSCENDDGEFQDGQDTCALGYTFTVHTSKKSSNSLTPGYRGWRTPETETANGGIQEEAYASEVSLAFVRETQGGKLKVLGLAGVGDDFRRLLVQYEGAGRFDLRGSVKQLNGEQPDDAPTIDFDGAIVGHFGNADVGVLYRTNDDLALALTARYRKDAGLYVFGKRNPHSGDGFVIAELGQDAVLPGFFAADSVPGTFGAMDGVPPFVTNLPLNTAQRSAQIGYFSNGSGSKGWAVAGGALGRGFVARTGVSYGSAGFGVPLEMGYVGSILGGSTELSLVGRTELGRGNGGQLTVGLNRKF